MRRKWFLLENRHDRGTDFSKLHHVESCRSASAACGHQTKQGTLGVPLYPKKQPPKCRDCLRALDKKARP